MKPIVVFAMLIMFDRVVSFLPMIRKVSFKASCAYHMHIRSCSVISSTTSDADDPLLIPIPSNQYNITDIPKVFAYPHYYDPHPIAKYASERLKERLYTSQGFKSMLKNTDTIGKMMGVLVVQYNDTDNNNIPQLGYLQAYSGTLTNDETSDMHFCPPVHDRDDQHGFYKAGEDELNELNRLIDQLESNPELSMQREHLAKLQEKQRNIKWSALKKQQRDLLAIRDEQRSQPSNEEYNQFNKRLKQEKRDMKKIKSQITQEIQVAENAVKELEQHIQSLKDEHKTKSIQLQDTLFNQYNFLNIYNETKSLLPMFANTTIQRPPLGAGDCIAPKLLQYAFIKGYKPIAMAQFWWGNSPRNEVRRHGLYYPACRGKCGPILEHMLKGIEVEENPLQQINTESEVELEIIYEDEYIVVANKPEGILSQPGKYIDYSVYSIIKEMYPDATGPLLVHRLDMGTSGLLLIALDKDTHRALAAQFIDRSIQKRYVALFDGELADQSVSKGTIDLPLLPDYINRPMQMVHERGKTARTKYEVIEVKNNITRIHFYPVTGRTHQLRVHASHYRGLDCPIVGDDIYGQRADRLCLHADLLQLTHPVTEKRMTFNSDTPF